MMALAAARGQGPADVAYLSISGMRLLSAAVKHYLWAHVLALHPYLTARGGARLFSLSERGGVSAPLQHRALPTGGHRPRHAARRARDGAGALGADPVVGEGSARLQN